MTATNHSFFAADLTVTGTVTGRGRLEVEGRIEGDVTIKRLTINPAGNVTGSARAEAADLSGQLVGTIRADTLTVSRTGHLSGLAEYEVLGIEPGGTFEAECRPTTAPALETDRRVARNTSPAAKSAGSRARRLATGPA